LHIILVSNRLAKARTITVTPLRAFMALAGFTLLVILLSSLFSYLTVRHAAEIRLPFLKDMLRVVTLEDSERSKEFVRENLKVMAVKMGEMQARLTRLDTLGERVAAMTGIKPQDITPPPAVRDGRGGPLIRAGAPDEAQLHQALEDLSNQLETRSDSFSLLESRLFEERVRRNMLPTSLPIDTEWNASAFGWRTDPFTGEMALHEGVDFSAEVGTQIRAAAAGVVVSADRHPEYGNLIEIDHGNDMSTRYAHASKLLVAPGTVVRRGQVIALVGTTGRSTGPHLHFEVRFKGVAQNPNRFLMQARSESRMQVATRR
jgi:murein DD-endopeptidase MepM/ murein hydrolase activator NlpD